MTNGRPRCPNCRTFKIKSVSSRLWGMVLLGFVFGAMLLPIGVGLFLWAAAIIALFRLPFARGMMRCSNCDWQGNKANLLNNSEAYV